MLSFINSWLLSSIVYDHGFVNALSVRTKFKMLILLNK